MNIKGTKSEQNLKAAFAGESQARSKYTFFADTAKKEGHDDLEMLFRQMADNEREHARVWFKLLHGGEGNAGDNLIEAAEGENGEWKEMYPSFAATARAEGLDELAVLFERVASIEKDHERRFLEAFMTFKTKTAGIPPVKQEVSDAAAPQPYHCVFCGATSEEYLDVCPLCGAIGSYQLV